MYRKVKYKTANTGRYLTRPWKQLVINPATATTIFGCSFGETGWHHLKEFLKEYDKSPELNQLDNSLAKFLQRFCPK